VLHDISNRIPPGRTCGCRPVRFIEFRKIFLTLVSVPINLYVFSLFTNMDLSIEA
jgi:hypothetical protein